MAVFINELKDNYVKIPNDLVTDLRMNPAEFRLYCYVRSKPGRWEINNKDIMRRLGIKTEHTLSQYWKKLVKLELVKRVQGRKVGGRFSGYDLELLPYRPVNSSPTPSEPISVETIPVSNHTGTNHSHSKTDNINKTNNISKTKKKKPKKNFSGDVLSCYEECLKFFPEHLRPTEERVIYRWKDTIDKLNRLDGISFEHIVLITEQARQDRFWAQNFLSIVKLRKKNPDQVPYIVVFYERYKNNLEKKINRQTAAEIHENLNPDLWR